MTCEHARDIIEGLPRSMWSDAHVKALEQHIGHCLACRTASEAMDVLEDRLHMIPEPSVPVGITSAINVRLAAAIDVPSTRFADQRLPGFRLGARPAWVAALAVAAIGLGTYLGELLKGDLSDAGPFLLRAAMGLSPISDLGALPLPMLVGVLLYLAGLLASIGGTESRRFSHGQ